MSLMKILTIVYFCESVFGDFFTNCGCQKKQNQDIVKHFQKMTFFTDSKCHQNDASLNNAMSEATSVMIEIFYATSSGQMLTSAQATTTEEIDLQINCQHKIAQLNCFSIVEMIFQFLN